MSTNKSPLYLPWLLIICVSDDIVVTSQVYKPHSHKVVTSQVYKPHSHIVVTSQSIKKIMGSHPLLLCLQTCKCLTLLKQLCI
jgi:hypothetical protein